MTIENCFELCSKIIFQSKESRQIFDASLGFVQVSKEFVLTSQANKAERKRRTLILKTCKLFLLYLFSNIFYYVCLIFACMNIEKICKRGYKTWRIAIISSDVLIWKSTLCFYLFSRKQIFFENDHWKKDARRILYLRC